MAIQGTEPRDRQLIPHLLVRNASGAVDFYKRALGAVELYRSPLPGGNGIHVQIRVGDTLVMVTDFGDGTDGCNDMGGTRLGAPDALGGTSVLLEMYVDDVDAAYDHALRQGARATLPVSDTFWGDRYGWITDPFGHVWALATVKEVLTPAEVQRRMDEMLGQTQS